VTHPELPDVEAPSPARPSERDKLLTLFDLGHQVTSVLELGELLQRIPELIARLITFDAFAVFLLESRTETLRVAYSVGYPEEAARAFRLTVGQGLVGSAVAGREAMLVHDLSRDPRYIAVVPDMRSAIVVPLFYKSRPIGALNILSHTLQAFADEDVALVRQFGVHVAVALENARLFESERRDAEVFETLAEIGREFSSILDLDELLTRVAQLTKRVVDYRTFGILLTDDAAGDLEMKLAVQYGERARVTRVKLGDGLVGFAALHAQPVLVPDVSKDPRYIDAVADVRSELVIPLLVKDRCIGVFDLESPELSAFDKRHVEILTLLASHAAVAIENARLYEAVRANEERLEREVRFAQRVQAALLPVGLPKRLRGVDVAARFAPARELGGDFHDFMHPDPGGLVVAVGDVSGKGVPAALYSAFAGELVRSRTFRRRYTSERTAPAAVLSSINTILHERQLEEYFATLCYASFDLKHRMMVMANSGLPYPVRCSGTGCELVRLPGVPLGSFPGSTYDERSFPLKPGDVFVFYSDGISEATNEAGEDVTMERVVEIVRGLRDLTARGIVDGIFDAVERFRGEAPSADDMTVVAVRIVDSGPRQQPAGGS
jgi:phosphoserine phosphatase RsbU/P